MSYKVRGFPPFWRTLDQIADQAILDEVYEVAFRLVENGPDLPGADMVRVALPPVVVLDGWELDLESVEGFMTYALWGSGRILLVSLTLEDWPV